MDGMCKFMHYLLLSSPFLTQAVTVGSELPGWKRILSKGGGELPVKVLQSVLAIMASSSSQLTCLADSLWCMSRSFARLVSGAVDEVDELEVVSGPGKGKPEHRCSDSASPQNCAGA